MSRNSNIENALDSLRPALDEDGFDLRVGEVTDDGDVRIILEARADACGDCLVSDAMLLDLVRGSVQAADASVRVVHLEKVGF